MNVRIFGTEAGFQVYPPVVYREPRWGELHAEAIEIVEVEAGLTPRRHFVDCIRDPDKPMIASGRECLAVMAVLDAVQRSAASGHEVKIDL
jgi:predicted dehydrogenase